MKTLCLLFLVFGGAIFAGAADKRAPELPTTGVNLERDGGGWINFSVTKNRFVVAFFNAKKEPVASDVDHGLVRYFHEMAGNDRGALRLSADRKTLVSPFNVEGPDVFRVYLALFNEGPDDLAETYSFFYRKKWP